MKIEDVKKNSVERKSIPISVRTYPSYSKWMKEEKLSPTAIFNLAIEELRKKK